MPNRSVLLVDDNAALTEAFQLGLEDYGFQVTAVSSGEEAVTCSNGSIAPDVAIVDLRLGRMDGAETIRALQQKQPNLKFIVMSGEMLSPYFSRLAEMNVRDFLPKPFSVATLACCILAA